MKPCTRWLAFLLALMLALLEIPAWAETTDSAAEPTAEAAEPTEGPAPEPTEQTQEPAPEPAEQAEESGVPAGYPALRIDPATGKPYDLGGRTIYLYDYYSSQNWEDVTPTSDTELMLYEYRMWLQNTYNCKFVTTIRGGYMTIGTEMEQFSKKPDGSWCIFHLSSETGKLFDYIADQLVADWNQSTLISTKDAVWSSGAVDLMRFGSGVYGVAPAANDSPTGMYILYFNKDVLKKAGVNWKSIYDMQQKGTWTWDALVKILKKISKVKDISPMSLVSGSAKAIVFSNGGDLLHVSKGKLAYGYTSKKTLEALDWYRKTLTKYTYKRQKEDNWDYPTVRFKEGKIGFLLGDGYYGLNGGGSEFASIKVPWGCVVFPKGPQAKSYVSTLTSPVIDMIPNVYDQETLSLLTMMYELWCTPLPDTENVNEYLYSLLDQRAREETIPLLLSIPHKVDKAMLLKAVDTSLWDTLPDEIYTEMTDEIRALPAKDPERKQVEKIVKTSTEKLVKQFLKEKKPVWAKLVDALSALK